MNQFAYSNLVDFFLPTLNYISRERLDPLFSLFGITNPTALLVFELAILSLGSLWLVKELGTEVPSLLEALVFLVVAMFFFLGPQPFYLKVHWLPFLLAGALRLGRTNSITWAFVYLGVGIFWLLAAGSIAFWGVFIVWVIFSYSYRKSGEVIDKKEKLAKNLFHFITIFLLVASFAFIPLYPFPNYPNSARIVFDPISLTTPFAGPMQPIETVSREALTLALATHVIRALIILFTTFIVFFPRRSDGLYVEKAKLGAYGLLFCCFALTAEIVCLSMGTNLSPFIILRKLVPGLELALLPWVIISPLLFVSLCFFIRPNARLFFPTGIMLVLIGLLDFVPFLQFSELKNDFSVPVYERSYADQSQLIALSPSRIVLKNEGKWVADEEIIAKRNFKNLTRLRRQDTGRVELKASINSDITRKAIDYKEHTAWSTGRAQKPGDWFEMSFSKIFQVSRIVLSVRINPLDYPRGIKVISESEDGNRTEIINKDFWKGPIKWTKFGYPYYGLPVEVILDLPETISTKRLYFEQTSASKYNWSIYEVKLYR